MIRRPGSEAPAVRPGWWHMLISMRIAVVEDDDGVAGLAQLLLHGGLQRGLQDLLRRLRVGGLGRALGVA